MTLKDILNILIKRGWKPYGIEQYDRFIIESAWDMCFRWKYPWADWESAFDYNYDYFKIRELASIDSWLWQFVCENGMTEKKIEYWEKFTWTQMLRYTDDYVWNMYQYYLIESALKDESELEDFLLNNIEIDE